ncbi:unnamed protein product, partial [Ilex paraguariensis]
SCELCKARARMYCESDQAGLCWDCDANVHSANFLVARHSRTLLCHVCQSPTAWNASGQKLGRTVSVCEICVEKSGETEDTDGDWAEESGKMMTIMMMTMRRRRTTTKVCVDDEEDGDNQVVPWSSTPPPPSASSSSSEESSSRAREVSLKRTHEIVADLRSNDDLGCLSPQRNSHTAPSSSPAVSAVGGDDEAFVDSLSSRPLKSRRIESNRSDRVHDGPSGSRSAAIVECLRRFHEEGVNAVAGICGLSKEPEAVDFDSSESP